MTTSTPTDGAGGVGPTVDELDLGVVSGAGIIARYDRVVVLALPMASGEFEFVEDLLRVAGMAAGRPELPGRTVARRVAGLLGLCEPDRAPAFCVLAECAAGTAVLLHGLLEAEITGPRHLQRLSGRGVLTWIDNVISESFDRISVLPCDAPGCDVDQWTDLRRGVIRGSGVVLTARTAGAVGGRIGAAVHHDAGVARTVRTDDGASYVLEANYVIGRRPELHPSVQEGLARALVLDDPDELVSRVHARLLVSADRVRVVDEASGNGTYLAAADSCGWRPLPAGVPVEVTPGVRLLVGERELTFE